MQPVRSRRRRRFEATWVVVVASLALSGACGRPPAGADVSSTPTASATRTESPSPSVPPVPDASQFVVSNCAGSAPNTPPRSLGRYYTIRVVPGWPDTGDYVHTETLLLELTAPQSYGYGPTKIQFHSDLGPVHTVYSPQATAHSIAQQHATSIAQDTGAPQAVAGAVKDCAVGGEPASVFGFSDGTNAGYRLYTVRHDLLFEIHLFGNGGVSSQAIQDSLGMIGSLTWTS